MATIASKQRFSFRPQYIFAGVCFIVAAILLMLFFRNIPFVSSGMTFAGDWKLIWETLQNGHIQYNETLHIPPWDVLLILPLSFLSVRDSWSLLTLFTLCALIISVPRITNKKKRWRYWLALLLLVASYLNLRELVDGNFEGLVIAGVLIFLYGFIKQDVLITAIGALIMVTKPQEVWVLCLAAGWLMVKSWPRTKLMQFGIAVLVVVLPALIWLGPAWIASMAPLAARDTTNVSLKAITNRLDLSPFCLIVVWLLIFGVTVYVIARGNSELSRMKVGFVICTSLLLAPYAESNSFVTVIAIAIIPLLLTRPSLAGGLILLVDIPFFISAQAFGDFGSLYWFAVILLAWGVLAWYVYTEECRPKRAVPDPVIEQPIPVSA